MFFVQILEPYCALITFIIFLYAIVGVGWFISHILPYDNLPQSILSLLLLSKDLHYPLWHCEFTDNNT